MAPLGIPRRTQRERKGEQHAVITDARMARSDDIEMRMRRYLLTMVIRTACFIGLFFTHGLWRWAMGFGAAILPAIAVVLANAAENHSLPTARAEDEEPPATAGALTTGILIPGELHEEDEQR